MENRRTRRPPKTGLRCGTAAATVLLLLSACQEAPTPGADLDSIGAATPGVAAPGGSTEPGRPGPARPADTEPAQSTEAPGGCRPETSVLGDVDGDGLDDLISFDPSESTLVVCSGSELFALPGAGTGEILEVADLNRDGSAEILVGGTTAWGTGVNVAALVEGALEFVTTPDGVPLSLWTGLPPQRFRSYGCADFDEDGDVEVAVIEGDLVTPSHAEWRRTLYRVDGHAATAVAVDSGAFDVSGLVDPLAAPQLTLLRGVDC